MYASEVDSYFYRIQSEKLLFQEHSAFYETHKKSTYYYDILKKYINDKCLVFDAKDYALMCDMGDCKDNFKENLVSIRLSNLEQIYKIHDITKYLDMVCDIYDCDNITPITRRHGQYIYNNKGVINSIIDRYVHWCSYANNPYDMGESYFDNSVFCVRGYPSCIDHDEAYITGQVYLRECDFYARLKKITLRYFHFYKCNIVVTDLSGITFKDCIFEKCNFVKSVLFNNHNYKLLFNKCRFLEMRSYNKITTGDIKYFLQRKQVMS